MGGRISFPSFCRTDRGNVEPNLQRFDRNLQYISRVAPNLIFFKVIFRPTGNLVRGLVHTVSKFCERILQA